VRNGYAVADSRFVVNYYRMTVDHRLLFGGGENYSYRFPENIAQVVRPRVLKVFPQLSGVRFDYAWGGTLAITPNRMPYIPRNRSGVLQRERVFRAWSPARALCRQDSQRRNRRRATRI